MDIVPCTSGIYKITCTANRKIYVGSAQNLKKRWDEHRSKLRRVVHENPHLQNAWNKYGESEFTFEVIELVMPWSRVDREQYWLDTLNPCNSEIGFNRNPIAGKPPSSKGKKLSEEHRRKLAVASTGKHHTPESRAKLSAGRMGISYSDETRARMSKAKLGKKQSSESIERRTAQLRGKKRTAETRERMSAAQKGKVMPREAVARIANSLAGEYIVTSPDGKEIAIRNLAQFCRLNGLHSGHMIAVARGKTKYHKGWKCRYPKEGKSWMD